MSHYRSHVTTPARELTPWDEAQLLFGLARKRVDEGQMRAAFNRASRHAQVIASEKLIEYGYAAALVPAVPSREDES